MPSKKKILTVLVPVLALSLGLAFGLMTSPLTSRAEAASDDERIDMVDLLDAILGDDPVTMAAGPDLDPVARAVATYFSENFESGNTMTITGLWHRSLVCEVLTGNPTTGALRYGFTTGGVCHYDDTTANTGTASTGDISMTGAVAPITLTFNYFLETEATPGLDVVEVRLVIDSGTPIVLMDNQGTGGVSQLTDSMTSGAAWLPATVDLVAAGFVPGTDTNIDIQFFFNTTNTSNNVFLGFYIDDVVITADNNTAAASTGGPCVIASAAYGTPMADEIGVLRTIRDTYLLNNTAGTVFVDIYYRVSPAIAEVVAEHPAARMAVRTALVPVLMMSRIALASPWSILALALPLLALAATPARRRMKR